MRLECLEVRRLLSLAPIISEVDPGNKSGITDTLPGNVSNTADWLEVYNPDPTTAVNLSGWEITKATGAPNNTWNFPSGVTLGPGAFRVVFCDSAAASTANGGDNYVTTETAFSELNTGFNLPKAGDTVSLFNPSVSTTIPVSSLVYPTLANDTSYGPMETVAETDLVAAGATASYYCPTNNSLGANWTQPGFNASSWATGPTGLGFENSVPGFACTSYLANYGGTIGSVETADQVISGSIPSTSTISVTETDGLNFSGDGTVLATLATTIPSR